MVESRRTHILILVALVLLLSLVALVEHNHRAHNRRMDRWEEQMARQQGAMQAQQKALDLWYETLAKGCGDGR